MDKYNQLYGHMTEEEFQEAFEPDEFQQANLDLEALGKVEIINGRHVYDKAEYSNLNRFINQRKFRILLEILEEIDWNEFNQVINGIGPHNQQLRHKYYEINNKLNKLKKDAKS